MRTNGSRFKPGPNSSMSDRISVLRLFLLGILALGVASCVESSSLVREVLPSGMRVLIAPVPESKRVAIQLWVDAGSAQDPEFAPGLAHLVEHVVFKGQGFSSLARDLDSGNPFALTIRDHTAYIQEFDAGKIEHLFTRDCKGILALQKDPALLDAELKAVEEEERGLLLEHPEQKVYRKLFELAFVGHPYAHSTIGDLTRLRRVPLKTLLQFHEQNYRPERLVLVLAGNVSPKKLLPSIRKCFGSMVPGMASPVPVLPDPGPIKVKEARIRTTDLKTVLALGFRSPARSDPTPETLDLLRLVLYRKEGGLLKKRLVGPGMAKSLSIQNFENRGGSLFTLMIRGSETTSVDRLRQLSLDSLRELGQTPPSPDELDAAKRALEEEIRAEFAGNTVLAIAIATEESRGRALETRQSSLRATLKLTPEQLSAIAREVLDPERRVQVQAD